MGIVRVGFILWPLSLGVSDREAAALTSLCFSILGFHLHGQRVSSYLTILSFYFPFLSLLPFGLSLCLFLCCPEWLVGLGWFLDWFLG